MSNTFNSFLNFHPPTPYPNGQLCIANATSVGACKAAWAKNIKHFSLLRTLQMVFVYFPACVSGFNPISHRSFYLIQKRREIPQKSFFFIYIFCVGIFLSSVMCVSTGPWIRRVRASVYNRFSIRTL